MTFSTIANNLVRIRNSLSLNCRTFLIKTLYQFVKSSFIALSTSLINSSNIFQKNSVYLKTFYLTQLSTIGFYILKKSLTSYFFFSIWFFFHELSRITGLQWKGEGISLTPHYHFHPLHRHLDISRTITAGSSPLHIASSRNQTGNLWFPNASR